MRTYPTDEDDLKEAAKLNLEPWMARKRMCVFKLVLVAQAAQTAAAAATQAVAATQTATATTPPPAAKPWWKENNLAGVLALTTLIASVYGAVHTFADKTELKAAEDRITTSLGKIETKITTDTTSSTAAINALGTRIEGRIDKLDAKLDAKIDPLIRDVATIKATLK